MPFLFSILICLLLTTTSLSGEERYGIPAPGCSADLPVKVSIIVPTSSFWTRRGIVGAPIFAESGERLEVRWARIFPRYELWYFRNDKDQGILIGRCHFAEGCNEAFYLAPDANGNGVPDCFMLVSWTSFDYGGDDGRPGYLDRYRHIYEPPLDRYTVDYDLLYYACEPPISFPPDVCETTCDPPYVTRNINGVEEADIFSTEAIQSGTAH